MLTESYWGYIIEDFAVENSLTGYFAIIVAEWGETLKFHTFVFDEKGNSIEEEDALLIEIQSIPENDLQMSLLSE